PGQQLHATRIIRDSTQFLHSAKVVLVSPNDDMTCGDDGWRPYFAGDAPSPYNLVPLRHALGFERFVAAAMDLAGSLTPGAAENGSHVAEFIARHGRGISQGTPDLPVGD
ncbi:hypothetical protein, partial [Sphingomonas bacterium]|uniref:hypothetical protein n=1 Tax=Sphingomonas bacterium TaxID=1895847 RepID=UPI0015752496